MNTVTDWKNETEFWDRTDTITLMEEEGLELQEEIKARLRRSLKAEREGVRGIPAQEVAAQLGLEWMQEAVVE